MDFCALVGLLCGQENVCVSGSGELEDQVSLRPEFPHEATPKLQDHLGGYTYHEIDSESLI
jgi:hypothetical protein